MLESELTSRMGWVLPQSIFYPNQSYTYSYEGIYSIPDMGDRNVVKLIISLLFVCCVPS